MSTNLPTPEGSSDRLSGFLRQVVAALRDDVRSDATLLTAFVAGDQEAFRVLVGRHGRSVWAVCLAVLGDPNDAEDAFQAAFMALARRADTVDASHGVGPWVRTAARRAARQLRRSADRLTRLRVRLHEGAPGASELAPDESETWVLAAAELDRLSGRLRQAVTLYHLEGRTLSQVAEALGCSVAEAHRRVERGIAVLRERLSARGVALTASVLAALPVGLVTGATARAAEFARGAEVPPRLAALVDAALRPRASGWLIGVGAALVLACGAAGGFAAWPEEPAPLPFPIPGESRAVVADVPTVAERPTAELRGHVTDSAGRAVPGAAVAALVRRPWAPGDRGLRDDVIARTVAGADGQYRLQVPADFHTHYPERAVTLLVTAPGQPPATRVVVLEPGACDLSISDARTVRGALVGPDGRPAAGVRVGVLRLGKAAAEPVQGARETTPDGWPEEIISDKHGKFAFTGLPANEVVWVEVRDDRFALTTARIVTNDISPVRIALAAPRVLHGHVTTSDTGRPLAGARVSVFVGPWESHHNRYTAVTAAPQSATEDAPVEFDAVTSADGGFRLRLPSGGPYRVFVHPPVESTYLAVGRAVTWKQEQTAHELSVVLPCGETLRGVLRDERGKPVVGGWVTYEPKKGSQHAPKDMLCGRDEPVRTGSDGSFRIAVPPGTGSLSVFGPHPGFVPESYSLRKCPSCGDEHLRTFEHGRVELDVPPGRSSEPVALTLRTGMSVPARAIGPDGEPVKSGVFVCRSVVQPLRNLVTRPLLIRDGALELPGCAPGRAYPVVALDPERLVGAATTLRANGDLPVVRMEPCGTASVRLVDPAGRPVVGATAMVALVLNCDYPAGAAEPTKPGANSVDQSWFDPAHHLPGPKTDANGKVTLRALVPGVEYTVRFEVRGKVYSSALFRVKPGQSALLPDVVAGRTGPANPQLPQSSISALTN